MRTPFYLPITSFADSIESCDMDGYEAAIDIWGFRPIDIETRFVKNHDNGTVEICNVFYFAAPQSPEFFILSWLEDWQYTVEDWPEYRLAVDELIDLKGKMHPTVDW
jgi:hypothetical protein